MIPFSITGGISTFMCSILDIAANVAKVNQAQLPEYKRHNLAREHTTK